MNLGQNLPHNFPCAAFVITYLFPNSRIVSELGGELMQCRAQINDTAYSVTVCLSILIEIRLYFYHPRLDRNGRFNGKTLTIRQ